MGLSPVEIGLILLVVVLIFGGKKLRTLGSDLGQAIKGFRSSMNSDNQEATDTAATDASASEPNKSKTAE